MWTGLWTGLTESSQGRRGCDPAAERRSARRRTPRDGAGHCGVPERTGRVAAERAEAAPPQARLVCHPTCCGLGSARGRGRGDCRVRAAGLAGLAGRERVCRCGPVRGGAGVAPPTPPGACTPGRPGAGAGTVGASAGRPAGAPIRWVGYGRPCGWAPIVLWPRGRRAPRRWWYALARPNARTSSQTGRGPPGGPGEPCAGFGRRWPGRGVAVVSAETVHPGRAGGADPEPAGGARRFAWGAGGTEPVPRVESRGTGWPESGDPVGCGRNR